MKKLVLTLSLSLGLVFLIPHFTRAHEMPLAGAVLLGEGGNSGVEIKAKNGFTKLMQVLKDTFSSADEEANSATVLKSIQNSDVALSQNTASVVGAQEFHNYNHDLLLNGLNYKSKSIFSSNKLREISKTNIYTLLAERKAKLLSMIKTNPEAVAAYALPLFTKTLLPNGTEGLYEKPATLTGQIRVFHTDDFTHDKGGDIFKYELIVNKKKMDFYPVHPPNVTPGSEVKVKGFVLDNIVVGIVDQSSVKASKSYDYHNNENVQSQDRKTLAILIKFTDSPADPFTPTQAQDLIFNGQFKKFYTEQSYQKVNITGDVAGWFTLNHPNINCDPITLGGGELDSIIQQNSIDLSQYGQVLVVQNCIQDATHNYVIPSAYVGQNDYYVNGQLYHLALAWISASGTRFLENSIWSQSIPPPFAWTNLDTMLSHEVGHGFGLWHAHGYDCGIKTITNKTFRMDSTCDPDWYISEYGNSFDVMGNDLAYGLHFGAFYKEYVGWFTSTNSTTATASGSYTINKYENGVGSKMLKIKRLGAADAQYYVEYRNGFGFDALLQNAALSSNKNGLLVNRAYSDAGEPPYYLQTLLDIRPTASAWVEDTKGVSLNGTKVFTDARTGISIGPITAKTATNISFNVAVNPVACVRNFPFFRFTDQLALNVGPGSQFAFWPVLYNDDYTGCAATNMSITMTLPAGFTASPLTTTIQSVAPETAQQIGLPVINVSSSQAPGTYYIALKGKNIAGNKAVTIQVPITVTN